MIKECLLKILKNDFNNLEIISQNDWLDLIDLSKKQNVSNILFFNLKKNKFDYLIPEKEFELLKNNYQKIIFRNMKIKSEIIKINKLLKENNIDVIFLKGSHLINNIYENIYLRYMQDIDLLVKKEEAEKTFNLTKNLSYITENNLDEYDYNFEFLHHLPKMKKDDIFLEIHSNIINNKNFNIENFWNNSIEINNIKYFDDIDLIIHLCIHISYQDIFCIDLRHYYDIFYILSNKNIDIEKLFNRANKYNIQKGVSVVIEIINKLFNFNKKINSDININDEIINKAINLMWLYDKSNIKEYIEYKKSPNIYKEFKENNLFSKLITVIKKVFIKKDILIHKYKINSRFWYLYYLVRLIDLIKDHYKSINKNKYYEDKLYLLSKIDIKNF